MNRSIRTTGSLVFPLLLLAAAVLAIGGCSQPNAGAAPWQDLPDEPPAKVAEGELFYLLMTRKEVINQNRAYQAFLIWLDGKDESKHFGQRIVTLEQRNLLDPKWAHDPLEPLTRGRLANMICRKLDLKTSVLLWLFGPTDRYARRELIYRKVMLAGGGDSDGLPGAEFVNVLKRADEYKPGAEYDPAGRPVQE